MTTKRMSKNKTNLKVKHNFVNQKSLLFID